MLLFVLFVLFFLGGGGINVRSSLETMATGDPRLSLSCLVLSTYLETREAQDCRCHITFPPDSTGCVPSTYLDEGVFQQEGVEADGQAGEGQGVALAPGVGTVLAARHAVLRRQTLL